MTNSLIEVLIGALVSTIIIFIWQGIIVPTKKDLMDVEVETRSIWGSALIVYVSEFFISLVIYVFSGYSGLESYSTVFLFWASFFAVPLLVNSVQKKQEFIDIIKLASYLALRLITLLSIGAVFALWG
jgi:positive regulator of sigma E activity